MGAEMGIVLKGAFLCAVAHLADHRRYRILRYVYDGWGPLTVRKFRFEQFLQRGLAELSHLYRR